MILERISGSRFSRVLPLWSGRTVALLAGGPSLTGDLFKLARRAREADRIRAIAINDSYLLASWSDVHYAADAKWHDWHTHGIDKPELGLNAEEIKTRWASFAGQKCSIQSSAGRLPDHVHVLRNKHSTDDFGLSLDPEAVYTGRHGGFQAFNIAVLAGASTILLLGYDATDVGGKVHWHGDHPVKSRDQTDVYRKMKASFAATEKNIRTAGVRVINCSMESAIETFPKMSLAQALEEFA